MCDFQTLLADDFCWLEMYHGVRIHAEDEQPFEEREEDMLRLNFTA